MIVEYVCGFAFGLFIFQSLFMRDMMGGSYWQALRRSLLPEWLSMNMMMAGMFPVDGALHDGPRHAGHGPAQLLFWGVMSAGDRRGFSPPIRSTVAGAQGPEAWHDAPSAVWARAATAWPPKRDSWPSGWACARGQPAAAVAQPPSRRLAGKDGPPCTPTTLPRLRQGDRRRSAGGQASARAAMDHGA